MHRVFLPVGVCDLSRVRLMKTILFNMEKFFAYNVEYNVIAKYLQYPSVIRRYNSIYVNTIVITLIQLL